MSITETYTPTETSTIEYYAHDIRVLSSGGVAVLDYVGKVIRIVHGPEADDTLDYFDEGGPEHACLICDGLGHGYTVGRETFTNGTGRPITAGGPCPLER